LLAGIGRKRAARQYPNAKIKNNEVLASYAKNTYMAWLFTSLFSGGSACLAS